MIHIYTGTGKGKTTAALGLALRAAGAGLKVYFCQFLKKGKYSELAGLKRLKGVTVRQFGTGSFIRKKPDSRETNAARKGLACAKEALRSGKFDVIILDEFNVALSLGVIDCSDALSFLSGVPDEIELVLTGRGANETLLKCADLVSEVKEVKHYYRKGIKARKGIEF
ncbi:MAG: cob(I)yrinic acid a,c-diamide adenosyltransferase [Deltaproteobacteria bacterium]